MIMSLEALAPPGPLMNSSHGVSPGLPKEH